MTDINIVEIFPLALGLLLSLVILPKMRLFGTSGMFFRTVDAADINAPKDKGIVEIGGIAIFPILLMALCPSLGLPKWLGYDSLSADNVEMSGLRIMQVIAGCALLYVVGIKNDMHGTGIKAKFLALLATAALFPISRLWIQDLQGLFGIHELTMWIGMPMTVIIVIFITEGIALLDDIDGLGMGVISIISLIFLGFCIQYDFILGALVSAAVMGVSLSYSILKLFVKSWKKTLVGNAGSYILGYIISYLTLSLIQQSGVRMPEGMIMIVFGIMMVPMLDVVRMLRNRIREGRSLLTPDRNLMQHRLIRTGINHNITPVVIFCILFFFASINTVGVINSIPLTLLATADIALWALMQFGISFAIRKHEQRKNLEAWQMEYGREAWEANVPVEVIKRKQQNFGTMGLPKEVILGKELDFIPDGMNSFERNTKRLFDLLSSGGMLLITSPLFLLSYILIKLDDGGPAIYAQERLGRFGRPFYIYKFRSMRLDAEKFGPALSHAGGEDDPRLTKVGKFLRAHHLDELPQLWNVFCGDMAFIGYRPERKFFIDQIMEHDPRYSFLYQIRPGVTSYATLYNGYTDTMEKMLRRLNYDLYYLEHRSFWFDIRILWLTFISIIFGKKF